MSDTHTHTPHHHREAELAEMAQERAQRKHYTYKIGPFPPFKSETLDGLLDPEQEHPFDGTYWHFFDIGTDATKLVLEKTLPYFKSAAEAAHIAGKALPVVEAAARYVPIVGVIGETIHVMKPAMRAGQDCLDGKLSVGDTAKLGAIYVAYAATGAGGIFTAGAKEIITAQVQKSGYIDERYVPHTLTQELQHAGFTDWVEERWHDTTDAVANSGIAKATAKAWKKSGAEATTKPLVKQVNQAIHTQAEAMGEQVRGIGNFLKKQIHLDDCALCKSLFGGIHAKATPNKPAHVHEKH